MIEIIIGVGAGIVFIGLIALSALLTQDKRIIEYEMEKCRNTLRYF